MRFLILSTMISLGLFANDADNHEARKMLFNKILGVSGEDVGLELFKLMMAFGVMLFITAIFSFPIAHVIGASEKEQAKGVYCGAGVGIIMYFITNLVKSFT